MRRIGQIALALAVLLVSRADAATISLVPVNTTVQVNDNIELDLIASGLTLGGFDLKVGFNPALASFVSRDYDVFLGTPLSFQSTDPAGFDTIPVGELSFAGSTDLLALQGSPFRLARLVMKAIAAGTADFSLDLRFGNPTDLTDVDGLTAVTATLVGTSVVIQDGTTTVPEPATSPLAASALAAGIALLRRRS